MPDAKEIVGVWLNEGGTPDHPTGCNGYRLLTSGVDEMERMLIDLVETALQSEPTETN